MKKNNRNIVRRMLAALMIMVWMVVAAVPAFAAPKIRKAEYEGKGRVEVDFNSKVRYQNVKVTVKDDAPILIPIPASGRAVRRATAKLPERLPSLRLPQPLKSKKSTMTVETGKSISNSLPKFSGRARKSPSLTAARIM